MNCIFCNNENKATSVEHIIPESFGNKKYLMTRSSVCDACNAKFSKFEGKALSNSVFVFERARLGIKSKKGKNVKGKVEDLEVEGNKEFKKQIITVKGLDSKSVENYDKENGTLQMIVSSFDKSEEAGAKLILKMGIEALYTSDFNLYNNLDINEARDYLLAKNTKDWPVIISDYEPSKFKSIPKMDIKYELGIKQIKLEYLQLNENVLLVRFKFGGVIMMVNILNRDTNWITEFKTNDSLTQIYPKHYRDKI
ncbi:MAG: HNH endonuclease [Chryseobacterium sp.]|uniref:HNH endonuclease n=1 Tax=Chryseobacterium sp. TaxID=1871047 RepID=UPI003D0F368C